MSYSFSDNTVVTEQAVQVGDCHCLVFGSLFAQVQRHNHEWRVEYTYGSAPAQERLATYGAPKISRLVTSTTDGKLSTRLRLADRPIVSRPTDVLEVLPDNTAVIYISTTLWISIWVAEQQLVELPAAQLSDTWFGPNTYEGEVCYASTTRARLDAALLEPVPFKAVTPVMIHNKSDVKLVLERVNLPVPFLTLYVVNGEYWTSPVRVTVEADLSRAKIDIDPDHLKREEEKTQLAEPRKGSGKGVLDKAINLLLA
ncbi:hypothetical protein FKG94_12295 [Exilibacterium tricleocarpae]|uniref:DUF432 domain-containing protein n=1 Tax=Exilibacterium tricleocarpae TaxID=2591008 RepID=A0A545TNK3_9GAMM|nr:hypothetical protein [Exilibacterium tricleocarpae]TQV78795.1 hypothetical protein FKG94_12295 [Exilibacterium tricleocarpae]